ncbi:MAG: hypothetical protein JWM10_70 [Myxococcaceae bacterium]|nr:hypothetical protein [Myxococcaceae bacterium]
MRGRRALLLALIAPACAPAPSADPPTEAPPVTLAAGQARTPLHPTTIETSPDPQVLRVHGAMIARLGRGDARRFRDTFGEFVGAAPVAYAVPVRAGECYRFFVSAEGVVGDLIVRLLDPTTLLEDDGRYGAYASLLGQRRPLCAERDRVWRLEVSGAQGTGRYVVSVLARSGSDDVSRAGLRTWGTE